LLNASGARLAAWIPASAAALRLQIIVESNGRVYTRLPMSPEWTVAKLVIQHDVQHGLWQR